MTTNWRTVLLGQVLTSLILSRGADAQSPRAEVALPPPVRAVWDLDKASREQTPTRERVCLNGLWRWQPAAEPADSVPADRWGFFKVPGFWPGDSNYIQEDCQTLYAHPSWRATDLRAITAAWYEREINVPSGWAGRRIALALQYVNSFAVVFVDGKKAGEVRFPAGELDLTAICRPGGKHRLSLLVLAMPLKGIMLSYSDTNSAKQVRGTVERRGLCGDVYLASTPAGARVSDVKIDTSVRQRQLTVEASLEGLAADATYRLRVDISPQGRGSSAPPTTAASSRAPLERSVHQFTSLPFRAGDLKQGRPGAEPTTGGSLGQLTPAARRITVTENWMPGQLWDTHTPQHMFDLHVSLLEAGADSRPAPGKLLDLAAPVRFGFREFWIDGRDFYLNGTRIYLSAVPLDNAQLGARSAGYEGACETMRRLQSFGINFVYTHHYGCQPGSHVSLREILRAADDTGMLLALSQPHFGHYDWKAPDADQSNGYARHAEFYVRAAQNHPAVVAYSMSHNATGYGEDMNPDRIDGLRDPRDDQWSRNNARLALRAEAIVKGFDPGRIVYHHSSGNLGSMHTINFYANFVPIQEMSDWFEHWATVGVKPVFLCEYGVPFSWDWTMYRGWYKGARNFGSARVPWEFCLAEWNAQFLGDAAYRISEREKANLRFEARQFRAGNLWHRWDYPHHVGSRDFAERDVVFARYISDNWRAHRTWGLSANSPWEHSIFWRLRDGADTGRRQFAVDWDRLQRPGFSPDYTERRQWSMSTDLDRSDWVPTAAAEALRRNNRPLLGYIAGKPAAFTSKDHTFRPGETVEKQLLVINNSRTAVTCDCAWTLAAAPPTAATPPAAKPLSPAPPSAASLAAGTKQLSVRAGEQQRVPLRFELPPTLAAGTYELHASFRFGSDETQSDTFAVHVLPRPSDRPPAPQLALYDPKGETAKRLAALGLHYQPVDVAADLSGYDRLIVGKEALTVDGPGPNIDRVRDGLKVVLFEQTAKVLERRFGFRVAEYGLRQVFKRVPDHPALAGLDTEQLRDWRGEATLSAPQLDYTMRPRYGPTVEWCGIPVPRPWRRGCRGNVASVLVEKPARGDFLPVLDGGYALQYSPLFEYREGSGMVLFCQMDVTGRTEPEPAADDLLRNIVGHVSSWRPPPRRTALYAGESAGKRHLEACGLPIRDYAKDALAADRVLIVGPAGEHQLAGNAAAIGHWLDNGGHLLAIGCDKLEFQNPRVTTTRAEHIATFFDAQPMNSPLAGIGPADVQNRDPRELALVSGGAVRLGNGILAHIENRNVVFCQLAPWQFDATKSMNLKRTYRRTSCLVTRLAANMGVAAPTPLLARFAQPVRAAEPPRWLNGLYLDTPEEWDDPYRFFRW